MNYSSIRRSKSKVTRQAIRNRYLTRDPSGPMMRRLDLLLPRESFAKLEEIMDNTNTRRREALVAMIDFYQQHIIKDALEQKYQHLGFQSGLYLIALTTTDELARVVALSRLEKTMEELQAEIETTCWAERSGTLREAVEGNFAFVRPRPRR